MSSDHFSGILPRNRDGRSLVVNATVLVVVALLPAATGLVMVEATGLEVVGFGSHFSDWSVWGTTGG